VTAKAVDDVDDQVDDHQLAEEFGEYRERSEQYVTAPGLTPAARKRVLAISDQDFAEAFGIPLLRVRKILAALRKQQNTEKRASEAERQAVRRQRTETASTVNLGVCITAGHSVAELPIWGRRGTNGLRLAPGPREAL
jgi:hypothetical protein